jgi:hypothetical protein
VSILKSFNIHTHDFSRGANDVYLCVHVCVYKYVNIHVYAYMHTYIHMMFLVMQTRFICVYMCVCKYVNIHMYAYIHTYRHVNKSCLYAYVLNKFLFFLQHV